MTDPRHTLKPDPAVSADHTTASGANTGGFDYSIDGGPEYLFLAPPQTADELGRLGRYRVLGVLGRGGMGVVFRAEDPTLKRHVALKVMLPQSATNPAARARFIREAQAQAAVEHDHVIPIFHVEPDGTPFIAMPLLKGQSLSAALKANPRPPVPEVLRVGRQMAEGLAAAHAEGLVHRDIKPANVWLEGDRRRVKVLDFGLARPAAAGGDPAADHLTADGAIVGTPAYMSPEQARGESVDARTDLFSLGVVLYQMATGELPFQGGSMMAVLTALAVNNPVPPLAKNPLLPPALGELILRLLAKDPAARPASAKAVADDLRRIEASLSRTVPVLPLMAVPAGPDPWADLDATAADATVALSGRAAAVSPPSPRRRPPLLWAALAAAVLIAGGLLVAQVIRIATPRGTLEIDTDDPNVEVVVKKDGAVIVDSTDKAKVREIGLKVGDYTIELAESKGGLKLSTDKFEIRHGDKTTVKVRLTDKPKAATAVKPPGPPAPPAGRELRAIPLPGRPEVNSVALSRDGKTVAAGADNGSVYLWDVATGDLRARLIGHADRVLAVAFSPDGRRLASGGDDKVVRLWDVAGGKLDRALPAAGHPHWIVAFSPDGRLVVGGGGRRAYLVDTGAAAADFGRELGNAVAFAPAGDRLFSSDFGDDAIRTWDPKTGKPAGKDRHDLGCVRDLAVSPDGRHLAVAVGCEGDDPAPGADYAVHVVDLATGREVRALKGHDHTVFAVAYTPAGDRLVSGSLDKTVRVWDAATGRELAVLRGHTDHVTGVAVAPDGRTAASAGEDGFVRLWELPPAPAAAAVGVAHLDRAFVAWLLARGGGSEVGVTDPTGFRNLVAAKADAPPAGPFRVTTFKLFGPTADADLARLRDLSALDTVVLVGTGTTDAGLAHLAAVPALEKLYLSDAAKVTDAGAEHLRACTKLSVLHLNATAVTDAGLAHLRGLDRLTELKLYKTGVTAEGVRKLAAALPKCKIEWDGGAVGPPAPVLPAGDAPPDKAGFPGTVTFYETFADPKLCPLFRGTDDGGRYTVANGAYVIEVPGGKADGLFRQTVAPTRTADVAVATRVRATNAGVFVNLRASGTADRTYWLAVLVPADGRWAVSRGDGVRQAGEWRYTRTVLAAAAAADPGLAAGRWVNVAGRAVGADYEVWINGRSVARGTDAGAAAGPPAANRVEVGGRVAADGPARVEIDYAAVWEATGPTGPAVGPRDKP